MKRLTLCLSLLAVTAVSPGVLADIAPDPVGIEPHMRMVAEKVTIHIRPEQAHVKAEFELKPGDVPRVRYCRARPRGGSKCGSYYYHLRVNWPVLEGQQETLKNLTVTFNGKEGSVYGPRRNRRMALDMPAWYKLDSQRMREDSLPTMKVVVEYDESLKPVNGAGELTYVLRTGALWADTIRKAEITVSADPGISLEKASDQPHRREGGNWFWEHRDWEPAGDLTISFTTAGQGD